MKLAVVLLLVGIVTVSCIPQRGGGRRNSDRGRGRGREPCKDNEGIESCECKNGETCEDLDGCKETCGKIRKIASCTCNDGEEWTKPKKGSKPGKKDRPCSRRNKPVSCVCQDDETYEGDEIMKNCKRDNPPQECECTNGDTWVADEDSEEDSEEE